MLDRSAEAVLASVLGTYPLHASISDSFSYCGQWREREPDTPWATFHLLASGRCWLEAQAGILPGPLRLEAGDLVVFPRGAAHVLASAPSGQADDASAEDASMLCGDLRFPGGARHPVLDALPDCLLVRRVESEARFVQLAELLVLESRQRTLGNQVVLDKLADALFVMAVRHYLAQAGQRRGLLAALSDPRLALALEALHRAPGEDWTVARLAQVACLSRTAFAERFSAVLGTSPHQYLTELRMTEALRLLRDPRLSVTAIAGQLGYQSEAAFRRTFKRVHGHGPGAARRGGIGA
jgi:AraC family transcriptional regulator, activator of mtrCDE